MNGSKKYAHKLKKARKQEADITQSQAETYLKGRGLKVSARSLSKWENEEGPPKQVDGEKVIRYLKEYPDYQDGESDGDPIYPTVAEQGDGSFEIGEEPIGRVSGENALSRPGRDVFWVAVRGDSMEGTLPKNGLVPVCGLMEGLQELPDDDIYLFRLEGTIQIKRLQRRPGDRIRVVSDNDAYDDYNVGIDEGVDFEILGRVLV
jgi:phage repressor protein C with HTH and peptisase S24 domain